MLNALQKFIVRALTGKRARKVVRARTRDNYASPSPILADIVAMQNAGLLPTPAQSAAAWRVPIFQTGKSFAVGLLNSAAIQALLAAGVVVYLPPGYGAVYISQTLLVPSYSSIVCGPGTWLTRVPGVPPYHLIRNQYAQDTIYLGNCVASNGQITLYQYGHSWQPGQTVFLENVQGVPSMNGPQVVLSTVPGISFTIAAAGTPTNVGTPGAQQCIFVSAYNPYPASAFTRAITSATVTLTPNTSATVTFANSSGTITGLGTTNGFAVGMPVTFFVGSGTLPTGLNPYPQIYFVSPAGSGAGSGQCSLYPTGAGQNYLATSQVFSTQSTNGSSGTLTAVAMPIANGAPLGSGGIINWTAHGLVANQPVQFSTTGTLPTGLSAGVTYWTCEGTITANSFQVSAYKGGMPTPFYGAGSGTITGYVGVVTVSDPGHTRQAGDIVYINGLTGDGGSFNNIYQIQSVVPGVSFAIVSAGQATSPTGVANVLADRCISYDLYLDGSLKNSGDVVFQANMGTTYNQNSHNLTRWFNVSQLYGIIRDSKNCWLGRTVELMQSVGSEFPYARGGQNIAVLYQMDACCDRTHIGVAESFNSTDDIVAHGVTCNPTGNNGYAGDTTSPAYNTFKNASMGSLHVELIKCLSPTAALKLFCGTDWACNTNFNSGAPTVNVAAFTIGDVEVKSIYSPQSPMGTNYAGSVDMGDSVNSSVAGGMWRSVKIGKVNIAQGSISTGNAWSYMGPLEIDTVTDNCSGAGLTAANQGEMMSILGAFSSVTVNRFISNTARTNSAAAKFAPTFATRPTVNIRRLDTGYGASNGYVLLARGSFSGCANSVASLTWDSWVHTGTSSTSNTLIYSDVSCDFANINGGTLVADGCATIVQSQAQSLNGPQYGGYTRNITIQSLILGQQVACGVGFGGGFGGTFNVTINGGRVATGNNLFQYYANSGTYAQTVRAQVKALTVTGGGLILSPLNSANQAVSLTGDTSATVDLTNVALTPLAGDTVWNTNAGYGAGIGSYGRTNAGAWAKMF